MDVDATSEREITLDAAVTHAHSIGKIVAGVAVPSESGSRPSPNHLIREGLNECGTSAKQITDSASLGRQISAGRDHTHNHVWRRFLPALCGLPVWLYVMVKQHGWDECFGTYYPLSIAMIFGSMIAGSTPLGGGVVAFPVTVLLIKFLPEQGRDFSLIIQSVGMTAASFLIIHAKRHLCHDWLILWSVLSGIVGMIVGFEVVIDGFSVNVVFTTSIVCFALAFWYRNVVAYVSQPDEQRTAPVEVWELLEGSSYHLESNRISNLLGKHLPLALTTACCIFGLIGGFLTSKLGSGSDMMAYMFGVFVWNSSVPKGAELPDSTLTASSVIIMACCSVVGTVLRQLTVGISIEVIRCWGACVPIVVLGAPLGSLMLTPKRTDMLRVCFYVCAVTQLVSFGVLKIQDNIYPWIAICITLMSVVLALSLHYVLTGQAQKGASVAAQDPAAGSSECTCKTY